MKYTYPNYVSLKEFKSDYFLLDQINYYIFSSFDKPIKYSNSFFQISTNIFFFIILIIEHIWVICTIINLIIYCKVISQLIKPIKKLNEAIETNSINDENIFKFKYDDYINDLFSTCKELLTGKIDKINNEKRLDKFNILSIPDDKKKSIDESKYKKNFIINNYLINKLLIKQNHLIDFSNNIQLNDYNDKKNKKNKNNINDNIFLINKQNLNIIDEIENKEIFKNNEEKDEENRKSYKKLFQITEYLYYYINKNEQNYYHINNNNIFDDENQVIKINNRNIKNSIKIKQNFFKNIKKNDNDTIKNEKNISINMINGKDITYLWYMEAKNKNNKSINYTINNKYEELFKDYYI